MNDHLKLIAPFYYSPDSEKMVNFENEKLEKLMCHSFSEEEIKNLRKNPEVSSKIKN